MCKSTRSATRDQRQTRAAALSWAWVQCPTVKPMGWENGILAINGTPYVVECGFCEDEEGHTWSIIDLRKADGTHYRLCVDPQGTPACDCPDAICRRRESVCKHAVAVREACEQLNRTEPTDADWSEYGEWLSEQEAAAEYERRHGEPVPF